MPEYLTEQLQWYGSISVRLVLAFILGGLVGYEREKASRPAGFRTHILVCLGSALVMVTAEFIWREYSPAINLDPTRLGAQVISGIGFLGAGTIIRNGSSVKGLTTAASLWAVACIGLAIGSGFYAGALIATLLIFLVLISLKKIEEKLMNRRGSRNLQITLKHYSSDVSEILKITDSFALVIRRLQLLPPEDGDFDDQHIYLRLSLNRLDQEVKLKLVQEICRLPTVIKVVDD